RELSRVRNHDGRRHLRRGRAGCFAEGLRRLRWLQCGFCTPGFMMTVRWLLANNPNPKDEQIREALSSNLCRCTGYSQMYQAIRAVIEAERNDSKPELAEAKS